MSAAGIYADKDVNEKSTVAERIFCLMENVKAEKRSHVSHDRTISGRDKVMRCKQMDHTNGDVKEDGADVTE